MQFSQNNRAHFFQQLQNEKYDLLVIGGGITGCGIALDAALRGMKVALIEKKDFAYGTSSRSTKLIHGGLRYLKQLEFKLVHDVGSERAIVYHNARHIVVPEKMLLPIIKNGTLSKNATSIGLMVYDLLAGVKKDERRIMLGKDDTLTKEPLLNTSKVIGGGLYYEYRTDDARLVIELAKSAHKEGAVLLNYIEATDFIYDNEQRLTGVVATDALSGKSAKIVASNIINACGPFVDLLRKKNNSLHGKRLQLTKGVHLVFPFEKIPIHQAVYFDTPDGRMIFAIPRNGITYVGTTDTIYADNIDKPSIAKTDADYLIAAINDMFPYLNITASDILSGWAGLRPLIYEDGKSPSELSRKDEIIVSETGLISIAGGKLTGYRLMAIKAVDLAAKNLLSEKKHFPESCTKHYQLSGGEIDSNTAIKNIIHTLAEKYPMVAQSQIESWFYKYGTNTEIVITNFLQSENELLAELQYCYDHELILTDVDFLMRRTGYLFFDLQKAKAITTIVQDFLQQKNENAATLFSINDEIAMIENII